MAGEGGPAARTRSSGLPPLLEEPGRRRNLLDVAAGREALGGCGRGISIRDVAQRPAADLPADTAEKGGIDSSGGRGGVTRDPPANLVRHPVADPGERGLVEEEGLEGGAGPSRQEFPEVGDGEAEIQDLRGEVAPRIEPRFVEEDASELPVIGVDEGETGGAENEVIVLCGGVVRRSDDEAASHAEVKFEEGVWGAMQGVEPRCGVHRAGENEQEAFAMCAAGGEDTVRERRLDLTGRGVAKDAGARMSVHRENALPETRLPNAAGEFDFS
jgi:hypothetical protein